MRRLAVVLLLISTAAAVRAQTQPDIAILANVRARELRFEEVGKVSITVFGSVNGQPAATVSKSDRQNLPEQVQPYVTYRDIGIRLTITSTLPDIEQILDEALAAPTPAPSAAPRKKPKR
jgi:hypothetical protein